MNKIGSNFVSESTPGLLDNVYLLASLHRRFTGEENTSLGAFIELNLPSAPCEESIFISPVTQSEQLINQIPLFITPSPQSYLDIGQHLQDFSFISGYSTTPEEQLELEIVRKLKDFKQTREIYINNNKELTTVKVILDIKHYNHNLMNRIFNEAEFPIKDLFSKKLINFEYIPYHSESNNLINYQDDKLILNKAVQENLLVENKENLKEFNDYLISEESFDSSNVKFIYAQCPSRA